MMLPDFTKLKAELSSRLREFLERRTLYHLGPLSESPLVHFFEGEGRTMVRRSGEQEIVPLIETSAVLTFEDDELPTLTLESLLQRLDSAARDMAGQRAKYAYERISQAAESVGNLVDAKQMTFSAEMIIEALSKVHIAFDEMGRPQMPSFICHPDLEKAIRLAYEELDRNRNLRKQVKELLVLKKEEWRVQEASRRLVG
jgi:hypothetical protein